MKTRATLAQWLIVLLSGNGSRLCSAQQSPEEPMTEAERVRWAGVTDLLDTGNGRDLSAVWPYMVSLAVVEVLAKDPSFSSQVLQRYEHVGEILRTDKQVGAASSGNGTTSLLERPGIASLLALAIERGAIQQEKSSTTITLRSSPAAVFKAMYPSTIGTPAEQDALYPWLNRIGVSATGPIDSSGENLQELDEWSVQLNLNFWQSRSVYSPKFFEKWESTIQPQLQKRLNESSDVISVILNEFPGMAEASGSTYEATRAEILRERDSQRVSHSLPVIEGARNQGEAIQMIRHNPQARRLYDIIERNLETGIRARVRARRSEIPAEALARVEARISGLVQTHATIAQIRKDLQSDFADVLAVPQFSLVYTNHKADAGSNYSEAKIHLQYRFNVTKALEPFDIVGNAGASFYHHPDKMMDQDTVRDYSVGLGAQFSFENGFATYFHQGDLNPITLIFSGKVARLEAQRDEAGFAQAKLEIPVAGGFAIPISVTYATRTEDNKESQVRGNVGFTFDFDKLYALAALASSR